jgi:glycosyltransferase involved in cell wall biosynthesis
MNISIIFATYNRGDILKLTLDSFIKLNMEALTYEIIVVDNSTNRSSEELVRDYESSLPITYLSESTPGKNSALCAGIKVAQGQVLVFTDDDVLVDHNWLKELWAGIARHPRAHIYGGRILPSYPVGHQELAKDIDFDHWFLRSAYVIADWEQGEGPIKAGHIWGPNMAVKREVFDSGITFNINIGPNGKDYVMGSETEFLKRAYARGFTGVYLPLALVHHQIRNEQLCMAWISGRAFRSGKGQARLNADIPHKRYFGVPRYLFKKYLSVKLSLLLNPFLSPKMKFSLSIDLYMLKGQITQFRKMYYE